MEGREMMNIKFFRERERLSQAELAEKCELSQNHISQIEREKKAPSLKVIQKLCEVLNVTEAELLNGPTPNEIEVRIVVKESLDEMEVIDLSKDAPYLETVTLTPHKNAITVVFDKDKTVDDALEAIRQNKDKIESARAALYGE
jgi:transcriptional regulator with XRE-family HTH domain